MYFSAGFEMLYLTKKKPENFSHTVKENFIWKCHQIWSYVIFLPRWFDFKNSAPITTVYRLHCALLFVSFIIIIICLQ